MSFIIKSSIPTNKKIAYANFTFTHNSLKTEPYQCRLVVGGDKLDYEDNASSPAANLLETKLIIDSVISDADKGAQFMSLDQRLLPNFYHEITRTHGDQLETHTNRHDPSLQ